MGDLAEVPNTNTEVLQINQSANPNQLVAIAVQQGVDTDQLEKLMDLQDRWEQKEARKAYYAAISKFQSEVPSLLKKKNVSYPSKKGGNVNYNYVPLSDIAEQIRKPMMVCGLSYRFEQEHQELVSVTCVVTHLDGHSERNTMSSSIDASGNKNSIQAKASTVTYLMRYTLIGALGLTTADEDIDARLPDTSEPITESQAADLSAKIEEVGADEQKFLDHYQIQSVDQLSAKKFNNAIAALNAKGRQS